MYSGFVIVKTVGADRAPTVMLPKATVVGVGENPCAVMAVQSIKLETVFVPSLTVSPAFFIPTVADVETTVTVHDSFIPNVVQVVV